MATRAVFAGTFDPPHIGHVNIIERGARVFGSLLVAVGTSADKRTRFDHSRRVALLRTAVGHIVGVEVEPFDGLLAEFAAQRGAGVLLRSVRGVADLELERELAAHNRHLVPGSELETVVLLARPELSHVSSRRIREIALLGGDVRGFLPGAIREGLAEELRTA